MEEIRILDSLAASPPVRARARRARVHRRRVAAVALGVITIAGIAVAAIKAYVTGQTNKLGQP